MSSFMLHLLSENSLIIITFIAPGDLKGFKKSLEQLGLRKGTVVYFGREDFQLDRQIEVKTIHKLL